MSAHGEPHVCVRTSAVLALYLDGDVEAADGRAANAEDTGYDLACPDLLAAHLRDCPDCRTALHRARRLDCVLAESAWSTATRALDESAIQRLCATALAAATPAPTDDPEAAMPAIAHPIGTTGEPRRPHAKRIACVGVFALILAGAWLAAGDGAQRGGNPIAAAEVLPQALPQVLPSPASAVAAPPGMAPDRPTPTSAMPRGDGQPIEIHGAKAVAAATPQPLRAPWREFDARLARMCDADAGLPARVAAAAELLGGGISGSGGSARALPAIVITFAEVRATNAAETSLLVSALAAARDDSTLRAYLLSMLRTLESASAHVGIDDFAAVVTATRMGAPVLDEALRRGVRRHPELAAAVAAALREPVRATGGGRLLLDVWSDLGARGGDDDALRTALFAHQRSGTFAEITAELDATGAASRRVQCLLALAACPDRSCLATLRHWADAGTRTESYAAAFALSELPREWLAELLPAAGERGAFLLRAALARAGHPSADAWVEALHLLPRERALLRGANPARFPEVAEWFRDSAAPRTSRSDD